MSSKSLLALAGAIDLAAVKAKFSKIKDGETAVGVGSDDLKRLHALFSDSVDAHNALMRSIVEKLEAHSKAHEGGSACEDTCRKHVEEVTALTLEHSKAEAAMKYFKDIFWAAARIEFPELLGKSDIGVREGFTFVWGEDENPFQGLEELFGGILGRAFRV